MIGCENELARTTVRIDDGCDWTAWLVWKMRSNWRIRNAIHQLPPARPKVAPVTITHIKKSKKGKRRKPIEQNAG